MVSTTDIPVEFRGLCAVAGDPLDTRVAEENGLVAEYEGKKYYFCCPPCKAPFLANPENYTGSKKEIIRLEFISKEHVTDDIWSFSFTPKSSIHWEAGQYLRLAVPHDSPDARGTKRWFTISSAPYEQIITITTRVSGSSYKQALANLQPGDIANVVDLPGGDFIWSDTDDTPRIFVIGGIGITPLYSIAKQRIHEGLPLNATLLYANRNDSIAFREFFAGLEDKGLKTQYISGGELTVGTILSTSSAPEVANYYISGAKPMVDKLADDLTNRGIPNDNIISDAFSYYTQDTY